MAEIRGKNIIKFPFPALEKMVFVFIVLFTIFVFVEMVAPSLAYAYQPQCFTPLGCGVGGRFAPAACPIGGDCDVLNFPLTCSPTVVIIGPEGNPLNWGPYQWSGFLFTPDTWGEAYLVNGWPFTHAGLSMLGQAVINPNVLCPLPLLIGLGSNFIKLPF